MSDTPHRAYRVVRVVPEGTVGVSLILDGPLSAEPGQFVMVWLPGIEERPLAVMNDAPLSLTVARVGPFTEALAARQPNERVWVRGPMGRGFPLDGPRPLLIGGGSGVASLALLAARAAASGCAVSVALGARTAAELMLAWRFRELGLEPLLATEDGSLGQRGTVLDAALPRSQTSEVSGQTSEVWQTSEVLTTVYACGPEPMLVAVARRCAALGLPCWVSLERVMKCGLGICGACHCGEYLVCADGPVFPGDVLLRARGE